MPISLPRYQYMYHVADRHYNTAYLWKMHDYLWVGGFLIAIFLSRVSYILLSFISRTS